MSTVRDSSGLFLLKDDQLGTLKTLGRLCGVRVKKAARLCGEDPLLLSFMLLTRFCNKFSRLLKGRRKLRETVEKKWRKSNVNSLFAPHGVADTEVDLFVQKYAYQTLHRLSNFLSERGGNFSAGSELGDDEVLAQLVLYSVDAERGLAVDGNVGSLAWRRLCGILREEKRRAMRENDLSSSRDKAMSFLASVFLARLVSTYRVEYDSAFLDFIVALYDAMNDG